MRTEFICISVLRVASGPRVKLASYISVLNPTVVYSIDCFKAMVQVLVLLFVALWFILRGDLFYVLPYVIYVIVFFLGKRELILNFKFSYICSICSCLDLSVSSSSWCLGRAAVCDCGL